MGHLEDKHLIASIPSKATLLELLNDSTLTEEECEAFKMYYIKHQNLGFVADTLGWSYTSAQKHLSRAVKVLSSIARERVKNV